MPAPIDTTNKFAVGICVRGSGPQVSILRLGVFLTSEEAVNLAAWLVAMSSTEEHFHEVLQAIQES